MTWESVRKLRLGRWAVSLIFEPRDMWVGVFWDRKQGCPWCEHLNPLNDEDRRVPGAFRPEYFNEVTERWTLSDVWKHPDVVVNLSWTAYVCIVPAVAIKFHWELRRADVLRRLRPE